MPFTEKYIRPLAVAVIRYQGKILAVRGVDHVKNEVFFRLPGGGIEFGETAEAALKREFAEEFGVEVKIGRRLDVTETFSATKGGPATKSFLFSRLFCPTKNHVSRKDCLLPNREWKESLPNG